MLLKFQGERSRVMRIGMLILLSFVFIEPLPAQSNEKAVYRSKIELGASYVLPISELRDIQTTQFQLLFGVERIRNMRFTVSLGITSALHRGTITLFDPLESHANGIGPMLNVYQEFVVIRGFSLSPDVKFGVLFYDVKFPANAAKYSYMYCMGASVNYRLKNDLLIFRLCGQWQHFSNGKTILYKNPSYEGLGFGISAVRYFEM